MSSLLQHEMQDCATCHRMKALHQPLCNPITPVSYRSNRVNCRCSPYEHISRLILYPTSIP